MKANIRVNRALMLLSFLFTLQAGRADAQATSSTPQEQASRISEAEIDLSVPDSPAFTLLGLTPQNVTRPASPRALALSVLNGLGNDGSLQTGTAIDFSPYLLLRGKTLKISDYKKRDPEGYWKRFRARTSFSLATTADADDSDTVRVAAGVHMTPYDSGDPRLNDALATCLVTNLELPPAVPLQAGETLESESYQKRREEANAKALVKNKPAWDKCRQDNAVSSWNRNSWNIGLAAGWLSPDGTADGLESSGEGAWTSYAQGLGKASQLILHARYRTNELVEDSEDESSKIEQDSWAGGLRFRFGRPNLAGSLEALYVSLDPTERVSDEYIIYTIGLEARLSEGLWLQLGYGTESGRTEGEDDLLLRASFKYGFSARSQIAQ